MWNEGQKDSKETQDNINEPTGSILTCDIQHTTIVWKYTCCSDTLVQRFPTGGSQTPRGLKQDFRGLEMRILSVSLYVLGCTCLQ